MSMSFKGDMGPEAAKLIKEMHGDGIKAMDKHNVLFEGLAGCLITSKKNAILQGQQSNP